MSASRPRHATRPGFTLIEMLMALVVLGLLAAITTPGIGRIRDSAALRAGRQQVVAALGAARSAAVQKGKTSTLTLTGSSLSVAVPSGAADTPVTVLGPLDLSSQFRMIVTPGGTTPSTLSFNARGLVTPTPSATLVYRLEVNAARDSVCVSAAGVIMPRGCTL